MKWKLFQCIKDIKVFTSTIIIHFVDLPPPPPELMGNLDQDDEEDVHQVQSNTFRMLQQHVEAGTGGNVSFSSEYDKKLCKSTIF